MFICTCQCKSAKDLTINYTKIYLEEIQLNISKCQLMAFYTQVSDVKDEVNGIFTYG